MRSHSDELVSVARRPRWNDGVEMASKGQIVPPTGVGHAGLRGEIGGEPG